MRIAILLLTPILISATAAAQSQPSTTATPSQKPGKVEGVVTSSVNDAPVKKATVTLRNLGQQFAYAAISDAAGHFLFENVQPGSYHVAADSSGFMAAAGRPSAMIPITVAEEQEVKDVAVKLTPLGNITGHVLDADGEPLARANVEAMRYVYRQGRKQLQGTGGSSTNDLGEYQIIDLRPGRYYIRASAQPRIPRLPPHTRLAISETAYPSTFYPNGSDVTQAKATQVDAGAHIGDVDFRLIEVPSHHIRGKVVDSQPAGNVFVIARPVRDDSSGFMGNSAQVQPDGTFEFRGLVNGSYNVTIQSRQTPVTFGNTLVTVADQDVEGIVLQPDHGRNIAGSVTVEGPPPDSWKGMQISLTPLDQMGGFRAVVDSDATFSLQDVSPRVYGLNVRANIPGKYVKSIRFGDREIADGQIDLSHPSDGKLDIVLGSDGGQLLGGVQTSSGDPAVGALITLVSKQEGRVDLFKVATVDPNGNFTLKDVAPGEYMAFAWQDVDVSMVQSPDFRKPFESKGVSVTIAPSGQASIQLRMISTDDVEAEKSKLP